MSKHLFGLVVTPYGTAANNRGENEGNITTLQKILWKNEVHTTVSAEAIRWAFVIFGRNETVTAQSIVAGANRRKTTIGKTKLGNLGRVMMQRRENFRHLLTTT